MTRPSRPQHRRVPLLALVPGLLAAGAAQAAPADNPPPPPEQPSALIAEPRDWLRSKAIAFVCSPSAWS